MKADNKTENLTHQIFERSGIASLSDIQSEQFKRIFALLEDNQASFLMNEKSFLSPDYKWPRDPLHTWSRVWEYPYVYYQLNAWMSNMKRISQRRVVDVGSGVTFFPFTVAMLGCHVTCIDCDPIVEKAMTKAIQCTYCAPGIVDFLQTDGVRLPLKDGEVDAVYCISVLEHISTFKNTIEEMARILKPGGPLFLTIDLDLRGDSELGIEKYRVLIALLKRYFNYLYGDITIHPADMLSSSNGPYGFKKRCGVELTKFYIKQCVINRFQFWKPILKPSYVLTVQGMSLTRK